MEPWEMERKGDPVIKLHRYRDPDCIINLRR